MPLLYSYFQWFLEMLVAHVHSVQLFIVPWGEMWFTVGGKKTSTIYNIYKGKWDTDHNSYGRQSKKLSICYKTSGMILMTLLMNGADQDQLCLPHCWFSCFKKCMNNNTNIKKHHTDLPPKIASCQLIGGQHAWLLMVEGAGDFLVMYCSCVYAISKIYLIALKLFLLRYILTNN